MVKSNRSFLMYLLLSFITCGIYSFFFMYSLIQDMNTICEGDGKKTPGLLAYILLSFLTCGLYSLYWMYILGNRMADNAPRYGIHISENGTSILLWFLLGALLCGIGPLVAMYLIIKNINTLSEAYNRTISYSTSESLPVSDTYGSADFHKPSDIHTSSMRDSRPSTSKFCPQCGSPLTEGARFCGNCRYSIPNEYLGETASAFTPSMESPVESPSYNSYDLPETVSEPAPVPKTTGGLKGDSKLLNNK